MLEDPNEPNGPQNTGPTNDDADDLPHLPPQDETDEADEPIVIEPEDGDGPVDVAETTSSEGGKSRRGGKRGRRLEDTKAHNFKPLERLNLLDIWRPDPPRRRIEKVWGPTTPDPGDPADDAGDDEFTGNTASQRYVHDGARVIEQRRPNGTVAVEWVHGVGIDEPIRMTRRRANGTVRDVTFLCQNAIGSVVALTDAAGAVIERYKYLAFGQEEIFDAAGVKRSGSVVGNPIRWQGRWRDSAEGSPLTHFRARYYDTKDGRFTGRDPIGVWGDLGQLGNGYGAFGNNGVNHLDPLGLDDNEKSSLWTDLKAVGAGIVDRVLAANDPIAQGEAAWKLLKEMGKVIPPQGGFNGPAPNPKPVLKEVVNTVTHSNATELGWAVYRYAADPTPENARRIGWAAAGLGGDILAAKMIAGDPPASKATPEPAPAPPEVVELEHGTTLERARKIQANGPDRAIIDENSGSFAAVPKRGGAQAKKLGDPCQIARDRAANEGGKPAILELKVPKDLVDLSTPEMRPTIEWQGNAIDNLKAQWKRIEAKIRVIPPGRGR